FGLLNHDFTPKAALAAFTAAARARDVSAPAPKTQLPPGIDVQSLAGSDRIATAIAVSSRRTDAGTVVIATSASFPDAMVAGPLAAKEGVPILLTPPDQLDPRVRDEV